jgi:hypothetical protein
MSKKETINRTFSWKSFYNSMPWIILTISIVLLIIGYCVEFQSDDMKTFFRTIGATALASGLFSFLMKSSQYSDIYKEELLSIMYDTEHLNKRNDLPEIWENVSKVLFENKFPAISKTVTNDVKNTYLMKDHILYYEDYEQTIEIELIDKEKEIIKVTQKSNYIINPTEKGCNTPLTTNNTIKYGDRKDLVSFALNSFTINGKIQDIKIKEIDEKEKKQLKHTFSFKLETIGKNKIEHIITKSYSLKTDCVIGTMKNAIVNNFSIMITLKGDLSIDFNEAGTVKSFTQRNISNEHVKEFKYKGLLYPKQGYLFFVKIK